MTGPKNGGRPDGQLDSGSVFQTDGASALALGGRRIGVIKSGFVYVKEGDLNAPWQQMATDNVTALLITPNRIGVLRTDKTFWVKEGNFITAPFQKMADNVKAIALAGPRMGVINTANEAWIKDGLGDSWTKIASNVSALALGGSGANKRVGIVQSGKALAKECSTNSGCPAVAWVTLRSSGATKVRLNSGRAAVLTTANEAWANEGSLSASMSLQNTGVGDVQLN